MAELTCPKCGLKYYGVGCPNCDYPPVPPDPNEPKRNLFFGLMFATVGVAIIAQYFHVTQAHNLPVLAAGLIFALVGIHLTAVQRLYKPDSRASAFMGVLVTAAMCWLSLLIIFSDKPFEGGIPFIPDSWNQTFAKTLVGIGALILAAFTLRGIHLIIKPPRRKIPRAE
jgi:drug/metabolite transporter (DMT)-like permease